MEFDIQASNNSRIVELELKLKLYSKFHDLSEKSFLMRFTGPSFGIASGFLTVSRRLALIIENLVKGLFGILGAPFFPKCELKIGARQLFVTAPAHALLLPFSILKAALQIVISTIFMAIYPETHTRLLLNSEKETLMKLDPTNKVLLKYDPDPVY